ncbi:uncharacterized protein [Sinocyclocheilus grahami]|uniref:uncharacterized protein n=1 Tax=Sinocyclocheilus grahami TaxID=75366 RepID=UPI0007AC795C|nr:PREDICTED: uncharacterized protein LOC107575027 [Sinocyclocheilus grahami]
MPDSSSVSKAANDMLLSSSSLSLPLNETRSLALAEGRWSGWVRTGEASQCGESEVRKGPWKKKTGGPRGGVAFRKESYLREQRGETRALAVGAIRLEPSAEVALPPTERNMSPAPKRSKPSSDEQMPSGASAIRPPCKGKTAQKKTPWQQTEVQAVERHLKPFIISGTVPAKSDCEKCLKAEPEALRNRNWKTVKFYVYNRITAYKKKLQCR